MSMQKKTLPPSTSEVVFPPNTDYEYFAHAEKHPFRYRSQKFEAVNAWWLADAALLAYADEAFIRGVFQHSDFLRSGFTIEFFSGGSTQCFVASTEAFVIVAFRGTEVRPQSKSDFRNVLEDVVTDANCILIESGHGGKVHKGFKKALDDIWAPQETTNQKLGLKACLDRVSRNTQQQPRPIWMTGHSLGAALATVAADRFGNVQGLYTYGSPRVGDNEFCADFHVNTYRFVNNTDIVARLPLAVRYQHVGQMKYIDSAGDVHDNPNLWNRLIDGFRGNFAHMFNTLGQLRSGFVNQIPFDQLIDHTPLYYAIHAWNAYVDDRESARPSNTEASAL